MTQLLTTGQACGRLGVSRWTLWRLVRDGALQQVMVRSAVRYRADDIEALARGTDCNNDEGPPCRADLVTTTSAKEAGRGDAG